jgi:osmoprotectant transport system permease protein
MGMTGWQVLTRVELPLAMPLLMAGIRTAALFVVSTTTLAAYAGYGDSLGEIVNNEAGYHLSGVLGAAICIAALAIVIEVALALLQRALTPPPLRSAEALAMPDELLVPALEGA